MGALKATIDALRRAVQLTVCRARIRRVDESASGAQRLQVELYRDEIRDMDLMQAGLAVVPAVGTEALVICPGGDRGLSVVTALIDRKHRPTDMVEGEVCLYDLGGGGAQIRLRPGGEIEIRSTSRVVIEAPELQVQGEVSDLVESLTAMRTAYNVHTHPGDGPPSPPMGGGA